MRAFRVLGLIVVVSLAGLLSGGAAGAAPTASALVSAVSGAPLWAPASAPIAAPADAVRAAGPAAVPAAAAPAPPAPAQAAPPAAPVVVPTQAAPVVRTVPGTPCLSTASACIDLSANQAWLISEGAVEYGPVPITHGRKGWRTPPGTFRVSFKNIDHRSSIFDNAPMPYSVFFNGGIAFHQGSLTELSHGCIHLSRAAAKAFYGSLGRGDIVQVVR